MKKEFIKDEGRIRRCDSNLSKMNIVEFMYCHVFHWRYFEEILGYIIECVKESAEYISGLIINLVFLLFTPITLILCAIVQIRNAKKRCNKSSK